MTDATMLTIHVTTVYSFSLHFMEG